MKDLGPRISTVEARLALDRDEVIGPLQTHVVERTFGTPEKLVAWSKALERDQRSRRGPESFLGIVLEAVSVGEPSVRYVGEPEHSPAKPAKGRVAFP